MRFRGYRQEDVEEMFRLDTLCFSEPFRFDRVLMREFAEAPGAVVLLAEDGDRSGLIGFIILHFESDSDEISGYVVTIDVLPERRRSGIGAVLLRQAERSAAAAGAVRVGLHVAADNPGAIRFYESQKYSQLGVARRFYRQAGQDALVFAKDLHLG